MNFSGAIHFNKTGLCIFLGCVVILFVYMFSRNVPKSQSVDVNLKELLMTAIAAARNGGVEIVDLTNKILIAKTKEKTDGFVTNADFESHCVMMVTLRRYFPEITIVSEETNVKCAHKESQIGKMEYDNDVNFVKDHWVTSDDVTIWIDPLDATQEYTEKLDKFVTTMVCVAVKGKPVIGVIYKPFSKETYWAWIGEGRSSNLEKDEDSDKDEKKFIISRSHAGKVAKILKGSFKNFTTVVAGGAGYKVLELVKGKADAYLHVTVIKKWDICSGNAILNAVGGKMTTIKNADIDFGDTKNVRNEDGLIATLENHQFYIDELSKNVLD